MRTAVGEKGGPGPCPYFHPSPPPLTPTPHPQVEGVLGKAKSALVVGGGLTGIELAAELAESLGPGAVALAVGPALPPRETINYFRFRKRNSCNGFHPFPPWLHLRTSIDRIFS